MSSTLLAACAGGILFAAPFVFPALFPLAWVSLLPLLWAIGRASGPRQAFFSGWLTGLSANLAGFHWLTYTISIFGGFSYTVSGFIFLVFAAGAGLLFALFALAVRLCGFGPLYLFPPLFWVAAEFLFPQLFPWHFANSQSRFLTFIQSADLVGPYGTSFLLVWCNALLFHLLFARKRARPITYLPATVFAAVVFVILAYGSFRLSTVTAQMQAAPKLSLSAIQGNIDIGLKWNPDQARNNLNLYHELTKKSEDASLVVWPETAIEVWLPDDITQLPPDLLPLFHSATRFFIFGVRSFRGEPGRPDFRAFNSAFLSDTGGRIVNRYHKQALLAFGEYIPFSGILSRLPGLNGLGNGFTPGDGPVTLDLPEGARIAPLICYEDLLPALSRKFAGEKSANLLVNLTNDAWYGRTVAPWQHARLAQWRAIETRRSLVRVTNTGITTVIDPRGAILEALPIFTPGVLKSEVELLEGKTPYVRFGDWFAWVATLASLIALVLCSRNRDLQGEIPSEARIFRL